MRYSQLKYATELLELWINPMKIPCKAAGHNPLLPGQSCACRQAEIARRTREFLESRGK